MGFLCLVPIGLRMIDQGQHRLQAPLGSSRAQPAAAANSKQPTPPHPSVDWTAWRIIKTRLINPYLKKCSQRWHRLKPARMMSMSLRTESRSPGSQWCKRLRSKLRLTFAGPIVAFGLLTIAACSPGAAQKSDEVVCEELAISRITALAAEMNEKSVIGEINEANSSDYTVKVLLFERKMRTAIIQKIGIQIRCRVAIEVELMIDSRSADFESDVYTGGTEFNILFSRTPQQATILEISGFESLNFWVLNTWSKYIVDQHKRKQNTP